MPSAEIVAVGSELLTPEKAETNSLWLTGELNAAGVDVLLKTVVGDDEARLEEVLRDALKRSDIVFTTGGLGPTEDDITRQIAARAVDRELEYHDELEADLRERFRRWGRDMPEINKRQAYVIKGSKILPNPNGSAVGMLLELDGKLLVVLPGPPREMRPMYRDHVAERIRVLGGGTIAVRRLLRVSGMGESAVDEAVAPIYRGFSDVETSILFTRAEVEVHLAARSEDEKAAEARLDELSRKIVEKLGMAVISTNGETIEEIVGKMLADRGATLAVAESCTGGLIGMRLTEVPGASRYFVEGAITYSNQAKTRALGVPERVLNEHGAVSAETAEAMARGIRQMADADHGLSVTGVAGPDGGSDEKPVGTVFVGYSDRSGTRAVKFVFPGDREQIRWRSSQAALDYLRRRLLKASGDQ